MVRLARAATRIDAPACRAWRWLVLAPHPDDETLGAGALIHQVARENRLAALVYLTDGSGSHDGVHGPHGKLVTRRQREGRNALRLLTGDGRMTPRHLGWRDAAPPAVGDRDFVRSCRALAAICQALRVDAIAVTARHEPHCDHAAAAQLAHAVRAMAHRPIGVFEYLVWGDASIRAERIFMTNAMPAGRRRHALRAHRSQLTPAFGPGFRLPVSALKMPARDILYQRKSCHAA